MANNARPLNSVPLKVMINKKDQRVAFAEADATFIDTLASFLTIPLGTVTKFLHSRASSPSLVSTKNLYQSVVNLEPDIFYSRFCKTMLLHPKNAAGNAYRGLKYKLDNSDWEPRETTYFCPNSCSFGLYEGMKCWCGYQMTTKMMGEVQKQSGAFMRDERTAFLVDDDIQLLPLSTLSLMSLLQNQGLADQCNALEEKTVYVEVIQLLINVLFSRTPLTDVVFPRKLQPRDFPPSAILLYLKSPKEEASTTADKKEKKVQLKLILRKSDKKLLYAEAGSDFVDMIFSFLTIPMGAVVNFFGGNSPMKSLNSLSSSIKNLDPGNFLNAKVSKDLLVNPNIAPSFKCDNQLLDLIEGTYQQFFSATILKYNKKIRNPKTSSASDTSGGTFMKPFKMFMVTDDLIVKTLSSSSIVSFLDGLMIPISDLEEKEVSAGKCEALNLLKASLVSTTVLTDVFSPFITPYEKKP